VAVEVHQIKEVNGPKKILVTKCGIESKWDPKVGIPAEFSVWNGEVTCKECRH